MVLFVARVAELGAMAGRVIAIMTLTGPKFSTSLLAVIVREACEPKSIASKSRGLWYNLVEAKEDLKVTAILLENPLPQQPL
jgi:hypothetical protein